MTKIAGSGAEVASISYEAIAPKTQPFNSVRSTASSARFWHLSTGDTEWACRKLPRNSHVCQHSHNIMHYIFFFILVQSSLIRQRSWSEFDFFSDLFFCCPQRSFEGYNSFLFYCHSMKRRKQKMQLHLGRLDYGVNERRKVVEKFSNKKRWWWGWRYVIVHGSI